MPFGMKNAPATYQQMVNTVLSRVQGCGAYIDDLVLYSDSWNQHLEQLRSLLCRLQDAQLTVNLGRVNFVMHVWSSLAMWLVKDRLLLW